MLVGVFATLTIQAQIVHTDDVEIEKSDGAKLDMTHTGINKTWRLISGLYGGFQIGYLTGGLTGNTAPFIIKENGYIGMLMTSPNNILDPLTVNGNIRIFDANAGIKLGSEPFISAPSSNTFLGVEAGRNNTTGIKNLFAGYRAGKSNTTGFENLFLGNSAGEANVDGNYNTFIGRSAGTNNVGGDKNMFLGRSSGQNNVSGSDNIYVGFFAGMSAKGSQNVLIGSESGMGNTTATGNTYVGHATGKGNLNNTGQNTFIGMLAGTSSTGSKNVALGYRAGEDTDGEKNVFIGYNAGVGVTAGSNRLYIGNDQASTSAGKLIYGEFDNGRVGINTDNLDANSALTVGGSLALDGDLNLDTGFGIRMDNAPFISRIGSSLLMGVNAGNVTMTGASNVFVGALSGQSNTTGNRNAYFGEGAGNANTTGFRNVYLGAQSGNSSILGAENTFVGYQSGYESEGSRNTFLGGMAGRYTITGTANTSIGFAAGGNSSSTTGENTFIGAYAGEHGINSKRSVAIGFRAGSDVDGDKNVLIGYQAGSGDTNASNSLYIGNTTYDAAGGALIYGRFDQGKVGINTRSLEANSALTVGGKIAATEYLLADGSPLLSSISSSPWIASASDITFATGRVGIGTTGPVANLDVGGNGNVARFGNNAYEDQYVSIRNSTTGGLLGITPTTDGGVFQFQAGNNKGMRFMVDGAATGTAWSTGINAIEITKNGKVGINTTNLDANAALTVGGQFAINDTDLLGSFTSSTPYAWLEIGNSTGSSTLGYNNDFFWINAGPAAPVNGFTIKDDNVGIGTIGESRLHVKDGGQEMKFLTGTNSSGYRLDVGVNDDGVNFSNNSSSRGFNFKNNTGQLMSILADGQVNIGGDRTSTVLRVEATDEAGAPARAVGLELHGYEGRAKGIYITDKTYTNNKWFIGEGYNYEGIGIGYSTGVQTDYSANNKFFVNKDGEVGIGTITPSAKLDVNGNAVFHGKIESTKVKVSTTPQGGWPDYVFEPEFRLRPLSEVEAFVNENKHLPEVPSAKEVETNGIDLGNMDATLLKKVEELTLYMIEMNKKIEKLEEENKQLKELVKKDK